MDKQSQQADFKNFKTSDELRTMFLKFFENKQHLVVPSSSLIPKNDNSLLLINAGMAPLKPYFTGQAVPPNKRMTSCQKCIRTGDIDNVGKTSRHGTFFEMLGNFSFGDYFKKEAISWAWEFITKDLQIPKDKLFVTVFEEDEETANIWHEQEKIPKDRIFFLGKDDNFWEVGTSGPCGPCSEIYYDRGPEYSCGKPTCNVGCDCDRYVEFWNLVFTQYNRHEDGTYTLLDHPNIDTGMGLERLATIMQHVPTLFDIDTMKQIRDKVCEIANIKYGQSEKTDVSIRVITDHIRAITFLVGDGVKISSEGRGYILRRLIRRTMRHGRLINIDSNFLEILVRLVVQIFKSNYKELGKKEEFIVLAVNNEELRFSSTIVHGTKKLEEYIEQLKNSGKTVLDGELCFKLHDTFGFPMELTKEILEEQGFSIDQKSFDLHMENQKNLSRNSREKTSYLGKNTLFNSEKPTVDHNIETEFVGYDHLEVDTTIQYLYPIEALTQKEESMYTIKPYRAFVTDGHYCFVQTAKTPFYAESGGQEGDIGTLSTNTGTAKVESVEKNPLNPKTIVLKVFVESGFLQSNQNVHLTVDINHRKALTIGHTATHLLHKALTEVLGEEVEQAGSSITTQKIRFDFPSFSALSAEQIGQIEKLVNQKIQENIPVISEEMPLEEAQKMNAKTLAGATYSDIVRVVSIPNFSIELCGGTHVDNTSTIGTFKILSESSIANGVRRIEAVTGAEATKFYGDMLKILEEAARTLNCNVGDINTQLKHQAEANAKVLAQMKHFRNVAFFSYIENATKSVQNVNGKNILCYYLKDPNLTSEDLKTISNLFMEKQKLSVLLVCCKTNGSDQISFLLQSTDDTKGQIHCGKLLKQLLTRIDGKGGGNAKFAQGGVSLTGDHLQLFQFLADSSETIAAAL
ncbi:MAG: alanine--tRNA ligase [Candidatus Epulonipiscioides saccharophilum]|nr:MAG: alanine--tRNA ligase [Epulopiscium sp. AS2M-Bin001]